MQIATPLDTLKATVSEVFSDLAQSFPSLSISFSDFSADNALDTPPPYELVGAATIKAGRVSRPMRIEQDTRTADFSLRILDGYTGQRHEWSYSVIVPSNQVANPAQWLVDVGSARHGRRSAVYLESAAMFTANTLPDNPYAAANGTVGFILDCVQPDLVSGALSDIGKKWSSQPARTTYPKATHN